MKRYVLAAGVKHRKIRDTSCCPHCFRISCKNKHNRAYSKGMARKALKKDLHLRAEELE